MALNQMIYESSTSIPISLSFFFAFALAPEPVVGLLNVLQIYIVSKVSCIIFNIKSRILGTHALYPPMTFPVFLSWSGLASAPCPPPVPSPPPNSSSRTCLECCFASSDRSRNTGVSCQPLLMEGTSCVKSGLRGSLMVALCPPITFPGFFPDILGSEVLRIAAELNSREWRWNRKVLWCTGFITGRMRENIISNEE